MAKAVKKSVKPPVRAKNSRVTDDGPRVRAGRVKTTQSKSPAGRTRKNLPEAEKSRHKLSKKRKVADKSTPRIPLRVLAALGLEAPVVGVFRHPNRPHFGVAYTDETGRRCSRAFPFRDDEQEVAAYAKAIRFRKKTVRESSKRRAKSRK